VADRANITTPKFGGLITSLAIDVVLPLLLAELLIHRGVSLVAALTIAAAIPFAHTILGWVRKRRLQLIGVIAIASIIVAVLLSFATGNPVFALVKESAFTGLFAIALLVSLRAPRPLIYYLAREGSTGGEPSAVAAYDALWDARPEFRRAMRFITLVWGLGFTLEAALRVAAALLLPPSVTVVLSPLLAVGAVAGLIIWTLRYARRARQRAVAATAPSV
jgi:uncharacterized membrane protein (DUF485 family)